MEVESAASGAVAEDIKLQVLLAKTLPDQVQPLLHGIIGLGVVHAP